MQETKSVSNNMSGDATGLPKKKKKNKSSIMKFATVATITDEMGAF